MATIDRNNAPTNDQIEAFIKDIDFQLPLGLIDFYKEANGADISTDNAYAIVWPLTDLIQLNTDYNVATYAPDFFIFGSDGGGMAYAIEKKTGHIFEMPFIGMSKEEAVFKTKSFDEFVEAM